MINVLVSIRVTPSGESAQPEIEGDVQLLGDQPPVDGLPAQATSEVLPFAGWLQLLGHLEQFTIQATPQS